MFFCVHPTIGIFPQFPSKTPPDASYRPSADLGSVHEVM